MNSEEDRIKLLLVDDEEEFLAVAELILARRGIDVILATNGGEALKILKKTPVDVVVLDVKMPGMDGEEVYNHIKRILPGLSVIMLTGHGSFPQAFSMSKDGVYDYLAKPFDTDMLMKKIRAAAEKSREKLAAKEKGKEAGVPVDELRKIRVMLVDDEEELVDSLKTVLERRSFVVQTAFRGEDALSLLEDSATDVVVLDIKMPGMDGIETLRRIKQVTQYVEVILLTGHPSVETALKGMRMGARDYVLKPVETEKLVEAIEKAFEQRLQIIEKQQQETVEKIMKRFPD